MDSYVEHLGFRWRGTPEVLKLDAQPISIFGDIQDAIESLKLHTVPFPANQGNLEELKSLLNRKSPAVAAVAWDRGNPSNWIQSGNGIGHYLAVTGIDNDKLVCFDHQEGRVHLRELADNQRTYLLLVSGSPIDVQRLGFGDVLDTSIQSRVAAPFFLLACLVLAVSLMRTSTKVELFARFGTQLASMFRKSRLMAILLVLLLAGSGSYVIWRTPITMSLLTQSSVNSGSSPYKSNIFEGSEISLGSIIIGSGEQHQVRLVNRTQQTIGIDDIIPSCGCVLIEPRQCVLQPGEAKFVGVQITAANLGRNSHQLTMMSNNLEIDKAVLAFDGVNGPRLLPRTCVVGVLSASKKNQLDHQLTLENVETDQLEIVSAELLEADAPIEILLSASKNAIKSDQLTVGFVLKDSETFRGLFYSNIRIILNDESSGDTVPMPPMLAQIGVEIVE